MDRFVNIGRQPIAMEYPEGARVPSHGILSHPTNIVNGGYPVFQPHPVDAAEPDKPIGAGAFGVVWAVTDPRDGRRLALKKMGHIFSGNLGHSKRVFRELYIMANFKHQNVISLVDIVSPGEKEVFNEIYILTELMQSDLANIIASNQTLTADHIKIFMYQILRGLKYLHSAGVLHRDIKPSNLLVNSDCLLKICDFGLARIHEPNENVAMTMEVVTQYYRAPEIIMGVQHYDAAIDIWSVGCIFAELLSGTGKILFLSPGPIQQLDCILKLVGTPTPGDLSGVCEGAQNHVLRGPRHPPNMQSLYSMSPMVTPEAIHLLTFLLAFNPRKRLSATEALMHPYVDDGRVRFHTCMCDCCCVNPLTGKRICHASDLEPNCQVLFDHSFENSMTSLGRVRDMLYSFIQRRFLHQRRPTLKLNQSAEGYRNFQNHSSNDITVGVVPIRTSIVPSLPFGC